MTSYSIYANTPEECRGQICAWLAIQASNHRIAAGNAQLARTRKNEELIAKTYQDACDFLVKTGVNPITNR